MILINTVLLLYVFSIEDYRVIIVDFNLRDIAGYLVKIYYLEMRRLIEDNKLVVEEYNIKTLVLLTFHNIDKKLEKLEDNWDSLEELRRVVKLDMINKQVTRLLLYTKKECRKLMTEEVNFSPEVSKVAEM